MTGLRIIGGRVLVDGRSTTGDVVIDGESIATVGLADADAGPGVATRIDATGLLVAPGFIDLQINGGHGHDIASDPSSLWALAVELPRHGVTGFLPTVVSSSTGVTEEAIGALARRPTDHRGAEPLGLHFEGPMLNGERRGAHRLEALVEPSLEVIASWSRQIGIGMVTIAPELPGAAAVIRALHDRGVIVAAGHTNASAEVAESAIDAGVTMVTHLFNAMAPLGHRQPNLVGVALADQRLSVGLIADGLHVDPVVLAATLAAKGADRIALVTDAVGPMGLEPGRYELGATVITSGADGVRTADGVLAGSVLTMDQAVRNMVAFTGCANEQALTMAAATPASVIGDPSRGRIAPGARADLVLLDDDLGVEATIGAGRITHLADGAGRRVHRTNGGA